MKRAMGAESPPDQLPTAAAAAPGTGAAATARSKEILIESALDAGADARGGRATRADGWTPDRIRLFLTTLAECGVVEDACRAAGMSKVSAYNLRNRAAGAAFRIGWDAAYQLARRRLADEAMSRALNGSVERIVRNGEVVAERQRFDNRLTMAVLTRLDRICESDSEESRTARYAANEFEQFVDVVAAGGEGAAEFIENRRSSDFPYDRSARLLRRLDNYESYGVGHPDEIDVSDLDPAGMEDWTEEQFERARRSGLLRRIEREMEAEAELEAEDEEESGEEEQAAPGPPHGDWPPWKVEAPEQSPAKSDAVAPEPPAPDEPVRITREALLSDEVIADIEQALAAVMPPPSRNRGQPKQGRLPKPPILPRGADGVPFEGPPPLGWVATD